MRLAGYVTVHLTTFDDNGNLSRASNERRVEVEA